VPTLTESAQLHAVPADPPPSTPPVDARPIGRVRVGAGAAILTFAILHGPLSGTAEASWVVPTAVAIGALVIVTGILQTRGALGARASVVGLLIDVVAAFSLVALYSSDPRGYLFALVLLTQIEGGVVLGNPRAIWLWAGTTAGYAGLETWRSVTLEQALDPGELALRVGAGLLATYLAGQTAGRLTGERARVHTELTGRRAGEVRLRSLVERAPVGLILARSDGTIILANEHLHRILGRRPGVLEGSSFFDLFHGYGSLEQMERAVADLASGTIPLSLEVPLTRPDGARIWVSVVADLTPSAGQQHILAIVEDISDRRATREAMRDDNEQLEQRVTERTEELESANKELESFSYSVSHDLRAPLRAVDGFSQILLEDHSTHLDDEGRRVVGVIVERVGKMGRLIDGLLKFSRLGRQESNDQRVDMTALAREAADDLLELEPDRTVKVEIGDLGAIVGDPGLLRQVLLNYLANALKFTAPVDHSVIEVGSRDEGDDRVFWVRDNGVGFDDGYKHKLFQVFQRLHSTEQFEGTGIGLAIVQRIVHRHGGRVWAESSDEGGATFFFSLPQAKERAS